MVYSAQQQVPVDAANSPEAQQLISRLRELGVKVVAGTLHPPSGPSSSGTTAGLVSAATNEDGSMMFACGGCAQYNTFNVPKDVFYVVTAGTSVGIFKDSALADSFVTGVRCSVRKKYSSLESALGAFHSALSLETVKLLTKD